MKMRRLSIVLITLVLLIAGFIYANGLIQNGALADPAYERIDTLNPSSHTTPVQTLQSTAASEASSTTVASEPSSSAKVNTGSIDIAPSASAVEDTNSGIKPKTFKITAVGDIMLGRSVGTRLTKTPGGFDYAFSSVASLLKQGDIVFANLEAPFTNSTHSLDRKKKIVLKAKPESIEALLSGGFNLLSLANNHMMDYYNTGLYDTLSILDKNGIAHAGAGKNIEDARKPAILEKNGMKIGLIAYTDMANLVYQGDPPISHAAGSDRAGVAPRDYEAIKKDIMNLRGQVDILAVSLHWGVEESFSVSDDQVEFAHKLLDDGADMILGHHPHQFQGIEIYKGKPIIYSMGNFLFDQNDPENMESFIINMTYSGDQLAELDAIPVKIIGKNHVEVQTGDSAKSIISREAALCEKLGATPNTGTDVLAFDVKK